MRAALIGSSGPVLGREFLLDQPVVTIGRRDENTIVIKDPTVSRKHAEIRREGDELIVVDKGSTSGVLVNGEAISGERRLQDGDRIGIGSSAIFLVQVQVQGVEDRTATFAQPDLVDQNRTQFITRTDLEDPRAQPGPSPLQGSAPPAASASPAASTSPAERKAALPAPALPPAPRPTPPTPAPLEPLTPHAETAGHGAFAPPASSIPPDSGGSFAPPVDRSAPASSGAFAPAPLSAAPAGSELFTPSPGNTMASGDSFVPPPGSFALPANQAAPFSAAPEPPRFGDTPPPSPAFAPPPPPTGSFDRPAPGNQATPPAPGGAPYNSQQVLTMQPKASRTGLIIGLVLLVVLLLVAAIVAVLLFRGVLSRP